MADSTKEVAYAVTANADGFVKAMEQSAQIVTKATKEIEAQFKSVGDAFDLVRKQLLLITSVVAGGAFFKEAIGASNKLTGEVLNLSKRLGITAEEAGTLNTALGRIGSDSDTYIGAFDKFAKQIKKNEQGLQDMGLQTRDANGNLRDSNTLFNEAVQEVGKYKPGLDQTTAAMTFFGKSVEDAMKLQKLNNEVLEHAQQKNKELGVTVSQENVAASKKYRDAMADVGLVLDAVMKTVGDAVMPIFTRLAEWFSSIGPPAVFAFKVAIDVLATAVQAVILVFKTLWTVIRALVDPLFTFGSALKKMLSGDMKGATDDMMRMGESWGNSLAGVFDQIEADSSRTWNEVKNLWGPGTEVGKPKSPKNPKTMGETDKGDAAPKSQMPMWEAQLAEKKLAIAEQARADGTFHEMSKAEEQKYWQDILATIDRSSKDGLSVRKKVAEDGIAIDKAAFETRMESLKVERDELEKNYAGRVAIATTAYTETVAKYGQESKEAQKAYGEILAERRKLTEQMRALDSIEAENRRNLQVSQIELERVQVQESLTLGTINKQQALAKDLQFENDLTVIRKAALQERAALIDPDKDPLALAQINAQMEQLEEQHQLRLAQIRSQSVLDNNRYQMQFFSGMQSSMEGLLKNMMTGTMKMRDLFHNVFSSIGQTLAQVVAKMAADWAIGQIKMRLASRETALAQLQNSAVAAAGGAYDAIVGIPYVGPFLAPIAAGVAYAGVMAFGAQASAEGGYDIPASVNPIVQTHAREMILPAKHADVIRNLADSNASGAGGGGIAASSVNLHIQAWDGHDVKRVLMDNPDALSAALARAKRNGHFS